MVQWVLVGLFHLFVQVVLNHHAGREYQLGLVYLALHVDLVRRADPEVPLARQALLVLFDLVRLVCQEFLDFLAVRQVLDFQEHLPIRSGPAHHARRFLLQQ